MIHYFLDCPAYQAARVPLLQTVGIIVADIFPNVHHIQLKRSKDALIQIMINGDSRLEVDRNYELFDVVHDFIMSTGRMER